MLECFGILGANRLDVAPGIGSLQSATHGASKRNRSATVVHLAHKIPFWTGLNVAAKAVSSKAIDYFGKSPFSNFSSILGDVELKELPVMSYGVKVLVPLHHGFGRNQLYDGARWIRTARRRIGDCNVASRFPNRLST